MGYGLKFGAVLMLAIVAGCASGGPPPIPAGTKAPVWEQVFNGKDLTGWYTFYPKAGKTETPRYVTVDEGMIHVLGMADVTTPVETGYLATEKSFGNCRLRLEYKWGTKKFPPRSKTANRDSGILYFFDGPDKVFPNCLEFQVAEGITGDVWFLNNGYVADTTVKSATDRQKIYMPAADGGVPSKMTTGFLQRSVQAESLTDWNTLEVVMDGNAATEFVNGKKTVAVTNIVTRNGATPVTEGRIGFQVQGAEMWIRKVEVLEAAAK